MAVLLLGSFGLQCQKYQALEAKNVELAQRNAELAFQLSEKQAEVATRKLIRKGPQAVADAANEIPRKIEPKPGKTPVPAKVVEIDGVKLIPIEPAFLARLVEDSNSAFRKQKRIDELDRDLRAANKSLRRARATRLRYGVVGFALGAGVTTVIVLAVK